MDGPDKRTEFATNPNQLGSDQRQHKPIVPPAAQPPVTIQPDTSQQQDR